MTNVDLVRGAYEAYARGDAASVFALMDPEGEMIQTPELPWGGVHKGHEGACKFLGTIAEHVDALPHADYFIPAGEDVAVVGRLKGKARKTEAPLDIPIVHVWTVRNGKFVRFHAWIDTPVMLKALGA
jgi:uncharacterized protein